ncbi:MAG: glycoside hydrolase, partial [Thermoplasmata archaeon]|nr:glycoside hydrolase [Thermoplasmata archaeon]
MAMLRAVSPSTQKNWTRTLSFAGLVVLLFVIGSFAGPLQVHLSTSAGNAPHAAPVLLGTTRAPLVVVHPSFGNPIISSFTATPNPVLEGQSTLFATVASGGSGNLTYTYSNLPGGCATANTTALSCTPAANGTFVVTVNVTDIYGNFTVKNLTLFIEPYTSGLFWVQNSTFSDLRHSSQDCQVANSSPFFVVSCYSQAQDPSLLSLASGNLAVAYGQYTQSTTNTCPGAAANTNARIGWSVSSDGGHTFPTFTSLGNNTCAYLNAIEPSFSVSGTTVYGTFIEENASVNTLPANYAVRTGDALGFITGPSSGSSWTAVRTLVSTGSLARPAMATDGNSIYIVYENIANSSTKIAGGWLPISIHFIASTDGGVTWSAPTTLPGLNATAQYDALSPSINVNSTGAVTVVYATNRSCVDPVGKLSCDA